ncbi:MAG: hypothetical protein IJX38_06290 [Clostridia bacterium]|nr:hypothetical protein [Clostridia bacterium]
MNIDLLHNKILEDSVSSDFKRSVESSLIPLLEEEYGEDLFGILMYEDHLGRILAHDGVWYYPLTVFTPDGASVRWVCWRVDDEKAFKNRNPYSYKGKEELEFALCDELPEAISDTITDRSISYSAAAIPMRVVAKVADPLMLVGKYNQGFIDEMARQLTERIEKTMSVSDFASSTVELRFSLSAESFMEHTHDNVTYRRLLLTAHGCQPRDFWVKWTRLDGEGAYTAKDNVTSDDILFDIGEDVPRKIREKEYRYLALTEPDKYDAAMTKRAATEWRNIIKLAVKRGELVRIEEQDAPAIERTAVPAAEKISDDASEQLLRILETFPAPTPASSPDKQEDEGDTFDDDIVRMAMAALNSSAPIVGEPTVDEYAMAEEASNEDEDVLREEASLDTDDSIDEEAAIADFIYSAAFRDEAPDRDIPTEEKVAVASPTAEELMRAELEAKIRRELEEEARAKAEEARLLREEHERLRRENERLLAAAREAEEARRREEALQAMRAEEQRLEQQRIEQQRLAEEETRRAKAEEQARRDAEERARFAEAARLAVEQQRRIDEERAANEARAREQALALERERLIREDEARRAEQRMREEERRRIEEARRAPAPPPVEYMTKHAKLIFGRSFDPGVLTRIKEIVERTLVEKKKENIRIHMKAYPVDSYTINLDIMKIPTTEKELLVSIIKAIGNGRIGITKIIVE